MRTPNTGRNYLPAKRGSGEGRDGERELGMQTVRDAKLELPIGVWNCRHSLPSCVLGDEFELSRVQHVLSKAHSVLNTMLCLEITGGQRLVGETSPWAIIVVWIESEMSDRTTAWMGYERGKDF